MTAAWALRLTDGALMLQAQAGERRALGELYARLAARAYRTAFSVCRDRECAEDAVQDAFVAMWSARATYEPARGSVVAWAMAVVRYRALDLARRRTAAARRDEGTAWLEDRAARDDVVVEVVARARAEELAGHLARLPPAQGAVIRLGFFDGLTHEEIARRLALPAGTVKGRMRLGLTKLRSALDP